jgi:hypothetical protein
MDKLVVPFLWIDWVSINSSHGPRSQATWMLLMEFIHTVGISNTIASNNVFEETRGHAGENFCTMWRPVFENLISTFVKSSIELGYLYNFGPTVQRGVQWYDIFDKILHFLPKLSLK